jgi:hypothetical protein
MMYVIEMISGCMIRVYIGTGAQAIFIFCFRNLRGNGKAFML